MLKNADEPELPVRKPWKQDNRSGLDPTSIYMYKVELTAAAV